MNKDSLRFLKDVLEAPSPSGFEQPVRKIIARRMKAFCDEVRHDVIGNVIGALNPGAETRVMLAGHCDEIGMMVTNITDDGYIYFNAIGGFETITVLGQRVLIHNERGPVAGVVGRTAIHLISKGGGKVNKCPKMHELWIDIGAKNKKDAEKAVAVGDCITVDAGFVRLRNDLVVGRACDDRVGAFVVAETMRLLAKRKKRLKVAVYGVATTQEEVGIRGARVSAHGIDPHAGIAIDMGFASDYPTANKNLTGDLAIGKGPIIAKGPNINPVLGKMLLDTARRKKIPYQIEGAPGATGTDANVIQMTRSGVAAALVSVPNRYMHTPVEVVGLKDIDNTSKLLAATLLAMKGAVDFTPKV
ncbi:MAG: M42 family metallopeptidase [Planctomycetota bacterium]